MSAIVKLAFISALVVLQLNTQVKASTVCNSVTCTDRRASIHYRGYNTLYSSIRAIRSLTGRTTITIYLKNIQNFHPGITYFQIQTIGKYNNYYSIITSQDRVITLEDTEQVSFHVMLWDNIQYDIEYYMDCEVAKGKSVTVQVPKPVEARSTQYQSAWDQYWGVQPQVVTPPRCWIILPTMRNETVQLSTWDQMFQSYYNFPTYYNTRVGQTAAMEVHKTFVTLNNINLRADTAINVTSVFTDNTVMGATTDTPMALVWVNRHNRPAGLDDGTVVSSMILVDLLCDNNTGCDQAQFTMTTTAMGEADVNCVRREQYCNYNIGNMTTTCENQVILPPELALATATVDQLSSTTCPAYQEVLNQLSTTVNSLPEPELDTEGRNWYAGCQSYQYYCNRRNCYGLRRRCRKFCYVVTKILSICNRHSFFA
uniref:Uncharacterized LOC100180718 n=1 Tax=Ciona intestinalis TaxID=7719 RepID=H2XMG1_CIOIN|nr:uncharacterized protein LOC100180718 isoform X1 [Ciona intestinalis]|eukprot:XP_002119262.1 uncharacterized protein LOC100180718 isoform X1 [Ciona intestinalis]